MSNSSSLFLSNTKSRPVSQSPSKEVILQMELHIFIFTVEVQSESMHESTLQIEVHVLLTVEGQRESMLVSTLQIEVQSESLLDVGLSMFQMEL
jgi:hypothetical protein